VAEENLIKNKKVLVQKDQTAGKATGLALVGAAMTTVANFGTALIIAKAGAEYAGLFFVATAVVSILGNSSSLGAMTGIVYFMPKSLSENGTPKNVLPLLAIALTPVIIISMLLAVVIFIFANPLANLLGSESASNLALVLRAGAFAIPAWAISSLLFGATRALGTMTPQVSINQIFKPLAQIILLGAVFIFSNSKQPDLMLVGLSWSIPIMATMFLAAIATIRLGGLSRDDKNNITKKEFWAFTKPRSISVALQISLERIDVIIVGALASDALAGIYGAITRFITAGNYLVFSVAQATSPSLRKSIANNKLDDAKHLLQKVTGWMVLLTWPYFFIVAFKSDALIDFIDEQYLPGATALTILALGMTFSALAGPIDMTLLMLGRSKASLAGTACAIVIDLTLAWILIPRYGLKGAAIAWVLAVIVQNLMASIFVYKTNKLVAISNPAYIAAFGTAIATIPVALLTPDNFIGLCITGIVSTIILGVWTLLNIKALNLANAKTIVLKKLKLA